MRKAILVGLVMAAMGIQVALADTSAGTEGAASSAVPNQQGVAAKASPQLQQVIDQIKALTSKVGSSLGEMRAADEQMAPPAGPDVKIEPVVANGVRAEWISTPGAAADRVVLFLHGGGYIMGSLNTHRALMGSISRAAHARVLGLDYRLAPEHPFPAAVDDALAGYRFLLGQGLRPEQIVIAGNSAGGGLTLALLVAARDAGLPMPAGAVCLSPMTDLEATGESVKTRKDVDPIFSPRALALVAKAYLAGKDPRTPLASPLYADLKGLPPLLIQVGDHEVLLDDSTRLAQRARAAGVPVKLEVWPEMIHRFQMYASTLPEAQQAVNHIGMFIDEHVPSQVAEK
ncbi:alpha/beta fold hydrolase [Paraburkholderia sediminicola]|jgi:Esterase/lipase|nr:alpha/beta fold hydrolase [Paraburkholderia sediminicola]